MADVLLELSDDGEGFEARPALPQEDTSLTELLPLQGMLGIETPGSKSRNQMKEVWDFFSKDAQGVGDALYRLKQTEMKMNPPKLGESRLSKLYNYVKLQNNLSDLNAQLETL